MLEHHLDRRGQAREVATELVDEAILLAEPGRAVGVREGNAQPPLLSRQFGPQPAPEFAGLVVLSSLAARRIER
jgi:hypothetical protein